MTMISNKLLLKYRDAPEAKPLETLQTNMLNLLNDMLSEQHADPLIAQDIWRINYGDVGALMARHSKSVANYH